MWILAFETTQAFWWMGWKLSLGPIQGIHKPGRKQVSCSKHCMGYDGSYWRRPGWSRSDSVASCRQDVDQFTNGKRRVSSTGNNGNIQQELHYHLFVVQKHVSYMGSWWISMSHTALSWQKIHRNLIIIRCTTSSKGSMMQNKNAQLQSYVNRTLYEM